jgi:hypothetical protein
MPARIIRANRMARTPQSAAPAIGKIVARSGGRGFIAPPPRG